MKYKFKQVFLNKISSSDNSLSSVECVEYLKYYLVTIEILKQFNLRIVGSRGGELFSFFSPFFVCVPRKNRWIENCVMKKIASDHLIYYTTQFENILS